MGLLSSLCDKNETKLCRNVVGNTLKCQVLSYWNIFVMICYDGGVISVPDKGLPKETIIIINLT